MRAQRQCSPIITIIIIKSSSNIFTLTANIVNIAIAYETAEANRPSNTP